jgi:hypothetical protein
MVLLLGLLSVATAALPGTAAPTVLLVVAVLLRIRSGGTIDGVLLAEVALIPLIHQLAGIAAAVPAASRVDRGSLRPAAVRYLLAVVPVEIALTVLLLA